MGVWMPEMDDREATRAIKEELPKTSILMLTAHDREDYLLEAMRAGAASYVLKRFTPQQLLSAVRGVLRGEFPLDQKLGMVLLRHLATEETDQRRSGEPTRACPETAVEKWP